MAILFGTLLSIEIGFRWGRRETERDTLAHEGIGAVEAFVFALLGLLLGFSFAGAKARLDATRALIVAEADAIGTAYRRVDILPPDTQSSIRQQFKRLIEARLATHDYRFDPVRAERALKAFGEAEDSIWSLEVAATASSRELAILILPPINEMMDVGTARAVALNSRLPRLIIGLLVGAAIGSGLFAGYAMARRHARSWLHGIVYAALLALTVYTVLDLDRPRFGLINIDAAYQPLLELRETINRDPTAATR